MRPGSKINFLQTGLFTYLIYIYEYKYKAMEKKKTVLTSVKIAEDRFNDFKVECIRDKFSLTKLVNRCMDLYLNDEKFRNYILKHQED